MPGGCRRPVQGASMLVNPSASELREMARHHERTTCYGSASYVTRVRNRSAKNTYVVQDDGIELGVMQAPIPLDRALDLVDQVLRYLKGREVIQLDRTMGRHPNFRLHCRLYITREYARIPYMWYHTLFGPPADAEGREPDLVSVYVPEWPERVIFVHPGERVTYILGTDYFGECKKSFLRMAMYVAKQRGLLGLHAGSKLLRVRGEDGRLREVGFILFGLSGTGKTTLSIHDHGLSGEEGVVIRQDDVVMMDGSGYCYGTENGFFIKTEGLNPVEQSVLFEAATTPNAVFENIKVYEDGRVDFLNYELTSNGRGVILRSECRNTDQEIDLPKAHKVVFITRRKDIMPVIARLTPEQGAAFFMLGESIETSAGDPTRAGQSKREVGTNPFIVGPESAEGNRFLEILRANPDMECFIMNTGSVGAGPERPEGEKITIKVSTGIMQLLAQGGISWRQDPDWGYQVVDRAEGLDPSLPLSTYDPRCYYTREDYDAKVARLREERRAWLAQFPGLDPAILAAIR